MIRLTCPKCKSEVEIEDKNIDGVDKTVVFCKRVDCFFYDKPLIGLDRNEDGKETHGVYISEAIV